MSALFHLYLCGRYAAEWLISMKRIFKVLLSLCLVFCLFPSYAFAANSTYELDELGMSIELPSDHVVFTRNIKANDPNLSAYGLTKDGLSSLMQERSIYLNAWDEDVNYEIIVTMLDSPFEDYNQFSDTSLSAFVSALDTEYAGLGITMIRSEFYQHSQAKFAKIYISQPNNDETAYGLQYHTVYDGKAINITLHSYSGKIDSSKEAILKKIVDTVHFDTEPQFNPPPAKTEAFTYTDPTSGMVFTVPANWVEEPMFKEREFIDVKFVSNLEEGLAIIFASEDMLSDGFLEESGVSGFEKLLVSRSDLDNSMLTKADVAAMYGESESAVSMVTYGNKEYFIYETVQSGSAYGMTVKVPMTILVRCESGFMYMFQFCGTKDNPYYGDFVALLNSVKYPVVQDTHKQSAGIVFVAVVAVAIAIVILMARRRKQRKNNQTNMPPQNPNEVSVPVQVNTPVSAEPVTVSVPALFCHKCGCKLESGSRFCHKCGTMIPTKEEE